MTGDGLTFPEAVEAVRAGTHLHHPHARAGRHRPLPRELMERYFRSWSDECGLAFDDLMALGHHPDDEYDAPFNMAVMGLRLAGRSNGGRQAARRGQPRHVRRPLARRARSTRCRSSVTNGVHAHTWVSPEMTDLLSRYVLPEWDEAGSDPGADRRRCGRRAVASPGAGPRAPRRASCASGCRSIVNGVRADRRRLADDVLDPSA